MPERDNPEPGSLLQELTTILESTPAGIAHFRVDTLLRCNRRFERMLGFEAGTLIGSDLARLRQIHPTVTQVVDEALEVTQREGFYETELEITGPERQSAWYSLSIRRIPEARAFEAIAVLSDISRMRDQKAQLEALGRDMALQADRTRAILDSVFVGIVTLDDNLITWMNRSARRMFGGDLADFVGVPLSIVATSDLDHPFRLTDYLDDLLEGQSHTFECQVVGRDGRIFWVVGNAVLTREGPGPQRQVTYALLDIDRRREAEARSADARDTLRRIIEMAPMSITMHEYPSLRVLQGNRVASEFLLTRIEDAIGRLPMEVLPDRRAALLRDEIDAAVESGHPLSREQIVDPGHGMIHTWDVSYLPLAQEGRPTEQVLVVASDITEQRAAAQARLDAAITQREMLVREVHHRIKNNLQGVAGLLQQAAVRRPEISAEMSEVIGQVKAIAQVYGLQVGAGGPLPLHKLVEAITTSVHKAFTQPVNLSLQGSRAQSWRLSEADSIPVALCLNELLTNAHKHGVRTAPLSCEMQASEDGVRILIRNQGWLPPGFDLTRIRAGVYGLGLVRALLPRRSARLDIRQDDAHILTCLELTPPGIHLDPDHPPPDTHSEPQIGLWPQ